MAKNRTLNEIRQSKEYQQAVKNSVIPEVSDIDVVKNKIVESLNYQMYDMIFEAVNEEMSKIPYFQEETYFTEEGMNVFEDVWFEFYHEHHGDIMHQLMNKITN